MASWVGRASLASHAYSAQASRSSTVVGARRGR